MKRMNPIKQRPDDSTQTDQSEDSNADQPADESDQPVGSEDAGPQDQ